MTRAEIRDGALLLLVALMEGSLIADGKLPPAWAITVSALYLVFLAAYVRGLVRRRAKS
ncbi:hypothetical protein ACGFZS_34405 [Streptomyces sp. NPDC048288]|uniref:hypothetical protein n=1 Tax=Streptomyces sp. NPDC048288 TaxID=3365529 RepID=UPI0037109943